MSLVGSLPANTLTNPKTRDTIPQVSTAIGALLVQLTYGVYQCAANVTVYITSYLDVDGSYGPLLFGMQVIGMCSGMNMVQPTMWVYDRIGLNYRALIGGAIACAGLVGNYAALRFAHSLWVFLPFSVVFGFGVGYGYSAPLLLLRAWMPGREGLAVGIVVAGFGLGGTVFCKIQQLLVNPDDVPTTNGVFDDVEVLERIPTMFLWLPLIMFAMQVIGTILMRVPPCLTPPPSPARFDAQLESRAATLRKTLKTTTFWAIYAIFFLMGIAAAFIGAAVKHLGMIRYGFSDGSVTTVLMVAAIANGLGRPCWGILNDYMGIKRTVVTLAGLTCVTFATLDWATAPANLPAFFVWTFLLNLFVGGIFVLVPAATALHFGEADFNRNYGLIFSSYAISSLLFTVLWSQGLSGYCVESLYGLAACAVIAIGFVLLIRGGKELEEAEALRHKGLGEGLSSQRFRSKRSTFVAQSEVL